MSGSIPFAWIEWPDGSRFGVMFFSDPATAFANIRRSLKLGGRLVFVCWRALNENPWMEVPLQAALPFLQPVEAPDPTHPNRLHLPTRVACAPC